MSSYSTALTTDHAEPRVDSGTLRRWRGLIWREHLAHGPLLWRYVGMWLLGQIVLLLFFQPGIAMAFGIVCALYFGAEFGGSDARDRVLEFTLALPVTRTELYLVRFLIPGVVLACMLLGSAVAIRFEIAQWLWGLVVETGFTTSYETPKPVWLAAILVVPFATFVVTYVIASVMSDPRAVGNAGTTGFLIMLLIGMGGAAVEWYGFGENTGLGPVVLSAVAAVVCFALGYGAARVREGVGGSDRPGGGSSSAGAGSIIAILIAFLIFAGLIGALLLAARSA